MRRRALTASVVLAVAVLGVLIAKPDSRDGPMSLGAASDRLPNRTATDWVTYADHVVVVTVASAKEDAPAAEEVERGEGLILRDLTLRVEEVVWSAPDPERPAPRAFTWKAFGWAFDGSTDDRTKMAAADAPRMEVGHRYLMAIEFQDERCTEGDHTPAGWLGLGADSTMPYEGVIGRGEIEGRRQTVAQAKAIPADDPNRSLEDALAGRDAEALRARLEAARPTEREAFGPLTAAPCG